MHQASNLSPQDSITTLRSSECTLVCTSSEAGPSDDWTKSGVFGSARQALLAVAAQERTLGNGSISDAPPPSPNDVEYRLQEYAKHDLGARNHGSLFAIEFNMSNCLSALAPHSSLSASRHLLWPTTASLVRSCVAPATIVSSVGWRGSRLRPGTMRANDAKAMPRDF